MHKHALEYVLNEVGLSAQTLVGLNQLKQNSRYTNRRLQAYGNKRIELGHNHEPEPIQPAHYID